METQQMKDSAAKPIRTVREVMDEEYMTRGDGDGKTWTREELKAHHRTGDIIAELMGEGYTGAHLDAELARRIALAESSAGDTKKNAPKNKKRNTTQVQPA